MSGRAPHPMDERPRPRPWHAGTALDDFSIISYVVDPERLESLLPPGMEAHRFEIGGGEHALVSAVAFLDRDFRFRGFPWITLSCGQVNYRAYVRFRGQAGVWFFGTSLDSWLVAIPRVVWAMPWHHDRVRIDAERSRYGYARWVLTSSGDWGRASADVRDATRAADFIWLDSPDDRPTIVDPVFGWYRRRDGGVGSYSVWHRPLDLCEAATVSARFSVFEELGLIGPDSEPISAALQTTTTFDVHTPPQRVRA